jgi:hypothetical protein
METLYYETFEAEATVKNDRGLQEDSGRGLYYGLVFSVPLWLVVIGLVAAVLN